jgi:hypothetical protein
MKTQNGYGMLGFHHYFDFRLNAAGRAASSKRQRIYPKGNCLVLISVAGWVDHTGKECGKNESVTWKFPKILPGIKPETSSTVV